MYKNKPGQSDDSRGNMDIDACREFCLEKPECKNFTFFQHEASSGKLRYSLLFNTSHGILIREKWDFPPNPFIPAWSLSKSLLCLLLHPGLKPFLFTWKQWWCHCYINRGLLCSVFQPGLWVNGMACLVIQTCFWKKSSMSPNTTWLILKRKEECFLVQIKICPRLALNLGSWLSRSILSFTLWRHLLLSKSGNSGSQMKVSSGSRFASNMEQKS